MKIHCACGAEIVDQADGLPHKAHIIPDARWFELLDVIDAAIEKAGPDPHDKDVACMGVRTLIGHMSRMAWQCSSCGRLHVDDPAHELRTFRPEREGDAARLFVADR